MIELVEMPVKHCVCEKCGHDWHSLAAKRDPTECPKCGSREWNGKKVKRKPQAKEKFALPKPIQVREQE